MGIAPYKYFTFDGASSRLYDVYLTGEGVFNAPERAVNMIEIPGRNGNYALDQGKFDNITVTYKAGIVDASESNFADKMSAVRNWLCSKVGYKRLEDDYNPNEFRMAVFKSGVKVDHEDLSTGEFDITFECKPQRWLTSGETATAVANNGTLSNPTLFDASPLLEVKGYGDISIGGNNVSIENVPVGYIELLNGTIKNNNQTVPVAINMVNNNDTITIHNLELRNKATLSSSAGSFYEVTFSSVGPITGSYAYIDSKNGEVGFLFSDITLTKTTPYTGSIGVTVKTSNSENYAFTIDYSIEFDDNENTFKVNVPTKTVYGDGSKYCTFKGVQYRVGLMYCTSTMSALGNPLYIDLDIGEAWNEDSGDPVSCNSSVTLPSDLPVLPPGSTTFTYDNTITSFKVKPRWWKV